MNEAWRNKLQFYYVPSRGDAQGERCIPHKNSDGCMTLFHPSKRRNGSVKSEDCLFVRDPIKAAELIMDQGYGMRMQVENSSVSASMVSGKQINIAVLDEAGMQFLHGPIHRALTPE